MRIKGAKAGLAAQIAMVWALSVPAGCGDTPLMRDGMIDYAAPDINRLNWPDAGNDADLGELGVSEGGAGPCDGSQTVVCVTEYVGACAKGKQRCEDGRWGSCIADLQPGQKSEVCGNDEDDDCDGKAEAFDEDCQPCTPDAKKPCKSGLPGICDAGIQTCELQDIGSTYGWGECRPHQTPGKHPEDCNGTEDRDCDGVLPADDSDCLCFNGTKDSGESDVDCGGSCPTPCGIGKRCGDHKDCESGLCDDTNRCRVSPPVIALLQVKEVNKLLVSSLVANSDWKTVYHRNHAVKAGDMLRLRGQAQVTNDNTDPVRAHLQLVVDGQRVSAVSSQTCIADQAHHMPLWMDGVYTATSDKTVDVVLRLSASRNGANPTIKVEDGHGHVVIEHYRPFASAHAAVAADALALAGTVADTTAVAQSFGGVPMERTPVYEVSVYQSFQDVIRLLGQATSHYTSKGLDMHGQGIYFGTVRVSPWATENHSQPVQYAPLWTDAVVASSKDSTPKYQLAMHGVLDGVGGDVVAEGGHLYAMRFSRYLARRMFTTKLLHELKESKGASGDTPVVANQGWQTVHTARLTLDAKDSLRVTGMVNFAYPNDFDLGIACASRLRLANSSGTQLAVSSIAYKYITKALEMLPLRNELVMSNVGIVGLADAQLQVKCDRQAANPTVTLLGGRTRLIHEVYRGLSQL